MSMRTALRHILIAQRYTMTHEGRAAQTRQIVQTAQAKLRALPSGAVVALFTPHFGEPDVLALAQAQACMQHNAIDTTFALPVVIDKKQPLQFAQWTVGDPLECDAYGIAVPLHKRWVTPSALLIPCVAYCHKNGKIYRLGYGGGYYDRSLAALRRENPKLLAIGVAWRSAACELSIQAHDAPLDGLLLG